MDRFLDGEYTTQTNKVKQNGTSPNFVVVHKWFESINVSYMSVRLGATSRCRNQVVDRTTVVKSVDGPSSSNGVERFIDPTPFLFIRSQIISSNCSYKGFMIAIFFSVVRTALS